MNLPNQSDIDDQLNHCAKSTDSGRSAYPGMTFEQGVEDTIRWMQGDTKTSPIDPDDFFTDDE